MKKTKLLLFIAAFILTVAALTIAVSAEAFHDCKNPKYENVINGKQMTVKCSTCGKTYGTTLEIDLEDNAVLKVDEKIKLKVAPPNDANLLRCYVVIYEGRNDTHYTKSTTVPHGAGDYYVYIADYTANHNYSIDYEKATTDEERQKITEVFYSGCTARIPFTFVEEVSNSNNHNDGCARDPEKLYLRSNGAGLFASCSACDSKILYSCYSMEAKDGQVFCLGDSVKIKHVNLGGDNIDGFASEVKVIYSPESDFDDSQYTDRVPTEAGKYRVRLVTYAVWKSYERNRTGLKSWTGCSDCIEIEFRAHEYEVGISGSRITSRCKVCGLEFGDKSISIGEEPGATTCLKGTAKVNGGEEWLAAGMPEYAIVYHVGKKYTLTTPKSIPSDSVSCSIALTIKDTLWKDYQDGKITIDKAITEEVPITFTKHKWVYTADGYTLNADCENCADHASVTIDTSAVYAAARNVDVSGMKYDLYVDNGWKDKSNIAEYCCIYDGNELNADGTTTHYAKAEIKPQLAGCYTVKLGVLNKSGKVTTTTEAKEFYIADMPYGKAQLVNYGPTQQNDFTKPKSEIVDNVITYYVGTKSELLWCQLNMRSDIDVKISITDDIVFNPLIVTADGYAYSATRQIYYWDGFSNDSHSLRIDGNGHTIYGLFNDKDDKDVGFCTNVTHCDIVNLTIENSIFMGTNAGAFIGVHYQYDNSVRVSELKNCKSLFNHISGTEGAGGFVGAIKNSHGESSSIPSFSYENLINRSYVKGNSAGGIIGTTKDVYHVNLSGCKNISDIYGDSDAAGMIGYLHVTTGSRVNLTKCINYGTITGESDGAGLIGYLCGDFRFNTSSNSNEHRFDQCANFGKIVEYDSGMPECYNQLIGEMSYTLKNFSYEDRSNHFYFASCYCLDTNDVTSMSDLHNLSNGMTQDEVNSGLPCRKFGCVENDYYSDVTPSSCTETGVMIKKCAVCGKELFRVESKPHGHVFEYKYDEKTDEDINSCNYCGILYEDATGSLFGTPGVLIAIIAAAALILGSVAFIIIRKKKKAAAN